MLEKVVLINIFAETVMFFQDIDKWKVQFRHEKIRHEL